MDVAGSEKDEFFFSRNHRTETNSTSKSRMQIYANFTDMRGSREGMRWIFDSPRQNKERHQPEETNTLSLRPMTQNFRRLAMIAALACTLAACSSAPSGGGSSALAPAAKPQPKPIDAETGRVVLQRLYTTSRGWNGDTEPVSIQSQNYKNAGGNENAPLGHDGKSAVWRGLFASPGRSMMKTYMWSGLTGPDAPSPGITPGNEDPFSAGNSSTQPFQLVFLKTDSDQALETAQKHGGAALLKKQPELPVNFTLAWEGRHGQLIWHVIYGQSVNEPKLDVVIDASSNQFVRVEK